MSTGLQFANFAPKRLASYEDMGPRLLNYFRELVRSHSSKAWLIGGVFGNNKATLAGSATNRAKITFSPPYSGGYFGGVDNQGHIMTPLDYSGAEDESIGRIVDFPFENSPGVVYRVGYLYCTIPKGIKNNPRTGIPEFEYFVDGIGIKGSPDSVSDNGNGTITFSLNSSCDRYGYPHSYAGRKCLVFLANPSINVNTEAVAIETCVITWNGTQNRIVTTGNFGQNSISVLNANYIVVVLGPWVSKVSTNAGLDDMFIGMITGNGGTAPAGDITNQNLINQSLSSLAANTYVGGPAWLDGTTNPTTQVNSQISKIITDLSVGNGLNKIASPARTTWLGGKLNVASSAQAALDKVITDLSSAVATDDGAEKIGAQAGALGLLTAGSIRSQLDQLEAGTGALVKNIFGRPITDLSPPNQAGGQTFEFNGSNVTVGSDSVFLQSQPDVFTLSIANWANIRNIIWQGDAQQGGYNSIYGMDHPAVPPAVHVIHFINHGTGVLRFALTNSNAPVQANQFICRFNSTGSDYILPAGAFLLLVSHFGAQWYLYPSGKATPGGI